MYRDLFVLEGTIETVEELNKAIKALTGDAEDFFETDSEEWRGWVEYRDGKTIVLQDGVE